MAFDEKWIPAILQGAEWLMEKIKSRKTLSVKVSELENEVKKLTEGNQALYQCFQMITLAILSRVQNEPGISIDAGTIIYVKSDNGTVNMTPLPDNSSHSKKKPLHLDSGEENTVDVSKIFDGVDEEILRKKAFRPSERSSFDENT